MTMTADLRDQALRVAGVLEPEAMTGEQALAAVEDLATAEKAASGALLFAALRVARSSAWKGRGFATAADWLADVLGVSVREAAGHLGTAKKADRLPKTKKAMKQGDLSPDQAGAVTDGADADPGAEDDLLDSAARDTNKALKDKAAKAKAAATDSAARERRIRSRRSLRRGTDAEGAFWVRLYGPGVDAAAFEAMFRPFEELLFRHGRSTGARDTFENRSYDAFLAMLAHHTHLATQTANGATAVSQDPGPAREPSPPHRSSGPSPPHRRSPTTAVPTTDPNRAERARLTAAALPTTLPRAAIRAARTTTMRTGPPAANGTVMRTTDPVETRAPTGVAMRRASRAAAPTSSRAVVRTSSPWPQGPLIPDLDPDDLEDPTRLQPLRRRGHLRGRAGLHRRRGGLRGTRTGRCRCPPSCPAATT